MRIFKKSSFTALCASLALVCPGIEVSAQDIKGRAYAEVDWKVSDNVDLNAEYQLRTKDSFSGIERNQLILGASYKINRYFKVGADYTFIGHYSSSTGDFNPRHRFSGNLTGSLGCGDWQFSLRERLQFTHKSYDINPFEEVRTSIELKSRITVKYGGFKSVGPYAYVEVRNTFNAPDCKATYNSADDSWSDYEFLGYSHAYVNRVRGALGLEWSLSRQHSLDFRFMYDYLNDRKIDADDSGTNLNSMSWKEDSKAILCFGYKFSF